MDENSQEYQQITGYIDDHPAGVVSTINDDGSPHSAVVYVFHVSHHTVCFVTRNLTQKYQNIFERNRVSLTIFDEHDISTLHITGTAFITNDEHMLTYVMAKIEKMYAIRADAVSPIDKMNDAGDYVLIGIEIDKAELTLFQGIDTNMDKSYAKITIGS